MWRFGWSVANRVVLIRHICNTASSLKASHCAEGSSSQIFEIPLIFYGIAEMDANEYDVLPRIVQRYNYQRYSFTNYHEKSLCFMDDFKISFLFKESIR